MVIHRRTVLLAGAAAVMGAAAVSVISATGRKPVSAASVALRAGHLPNLTNAHALVARELADQGRPFLEPRLGPGVQLTWHSHSAGTAVAEALFAGTLDVAYAGPSPVLNGYMRSGGAELRVLAGALRGGAALVVPAASDLHLPADFRGKRIGTPALGNTQDVAARSWLIRGGLTITQTGGDALVQPTSNPDQLALFQTGALDAVWTAEPWVTRLLREAGGRILVEQTGALTVLVASTAQLATHQPQLAQRFASAHRALNAWIAAHPDKAQELARAQLVRLTGRQLPGPLVADAWARLRFDTQVQPRELQALADDAATAGLLRATTSLAGLIVEAHA